MKQTDEVVQLQIKPMVSEWTAPYQPQINKALSAAKTACNFSYEIEEERSSAKQGET